MSIISEIQWLINRVHVSTPVHEVEDSILDRLPENTPAIVQEYVVEASRFLHNHNLDLYLRVSKPVGLV